MGRCAEECGSSGICHPLKLIFRNEKQTSGEVDTPKPQQFCRKAIYMSETDRKGHRRRPNKMKVLKATAATLAVGAMLLAAPAFAENEGQGQAVVTILPAHNNE